MSFLWQGLREALELIWNHDPYLVHLLEVTLKVTFVSTTVGLVLGFRSSSSLGPHFGMTPKRYQSGQIDISGRISKIGDGTVRSALYEAAHIILTKPVKGAGGLKHWALAIAKRAGKKKAKVALARKLAVILHRMWMDWTPFDPTKAVGAAVA